MATNVISQNFFDIPSLPGVKLGVTRCKQLTTADTLTVPTPAHSTASAAVGRVLPAGQAACTATQSGNTVTLSGTVGQEVIVITLHPNGNAVAES